MYDIRDYMGLIKIIAKYEKILQKKVELF